MRSAPAIRRDEDAIFREWLGAKPGLTPRFVKDGVADGGSFLRAARRVVLLLKEPHSDRGGWDFRETVLDGPKGQATWWNAARWSLLLQSSDTPSWDDVRQQDRMTQRDILKSVAIVNLKKTLGGPSSVRREIHTFVTEYREFLRRQVALYEPHVTLLCGTAEFLGDLLTDDELGQRKTTPNNVAYRISPVLGIALRYCHPQVRGRPHRRLYENLARAVTFISGIESSLTSGA